VIDQRARDQQEALQKKKQLKNHLLARITLALDHSIMLSRVSQLEEQNGGVTKTVPNKIAIRWPIPKMTHAQCFMAAKRISQTHDAFWVQRRSPPSVSLRLHVARPTTTTTRGATGVGSMRWSRGSSALPRPAFKGPAVVERRSHRSWEGCWGWGRSRCRGGGRRQSWLSKRWSIGREGARQQIWVGVE